MGNKSTDTQIRRADKRVACIVKRRGCKFGADLPDGNQGRGQFKNW